MLSNKATQIAVVSDLHLGVHQSSEKWLNEVVKFVEWFRGELLKSNINHIILPGDFFHDRTDINLLTIQYAAKVLDIWKDFDIWLIPGNHDCYFKDNSTISSVSILKGYPNVHMFDTVETVEFNDKKIVFVPWGVSISDIPEGDVIIGHFELNGFKMNSFKVCEGHEDSDNLLDKAKLVLTGHFHTKQEKHGKKGSIVYVGSPYEMDYNDMGVDKGYHILDVKKSESVLTFKKYEGTTKHKRLSLSQLVDNKDKLTEYLTNEVKGNVVTFVVDKDVDYDKINALVQKIQMFEPLAFKGTDITKKEETGVQTENIATSVQIEQLVTEFVNQMALDNSEDVLKLVLELYSKYKAA